MSNAPKVLKQLNRRCQGHGGACSIGSLPHATASGRVAREAAVYPFKLREAILRGMRNQLRIQGRLQPETDGYQPLFNETVIDGETVTDGGEDVYRDAITGEPLLGCFGEAAKKDFEDADRVTEVNACMSREAVYKDAVTGQPPPSAANGRSTQARARVLRQQEGLGEEASR